MKAQETLFSMPRFAHVLRKELTEGWKVNLLRIVLMYGVFAVIFLLYAYDRYNHLSGSAQEIDPVWAFELDVFVTLLFVMGALSGSLLMERMKRKTGRLAQLMLPATMFEKYLSRWLLYTVGFLLVFLLTFVLADLTRVVVFTLFPPEQVVKIQPVPLSSIYLVGHPIGIIEHTKEIKTFIAAYFFLQSFYMLGSAVWSKHAFIKTTAVGMLILLLYGGTVGFLGWLLMENRSVTPFISYHTFIKLVTTFFGVMALVNWVLAYVRFKESELINRW
ncbi:MAG: hypothetical protein LBM06_06585 [Prevotellaceae bacterium]|jgi:hypothetical protein|nr:hypothetical protein [Prevotellaceae bacterium]